MLRPSPRHPLLVAAALVAVSSGCLFPNSSNNVVDPASSSDGSQVKPDPGTGTTTAAPSARCIQAWPKETSDNDALAMPNLWYLTAQKYHPNGKIADEVLGSAQTSFMGQASVCVPADHAEDALILSATHAVFGLTVTRYVPPASKMATLSNAQTAPLVIDLLTTHLTTIVSDVHELPFSGYIGGVSNDSFSAIEAKLRLENDIDEGLEDGVLSEATTRTEWNDNVKAVAGVGGQLGCLNSQIPVGSFSTSSAFTFPGAVPEAFSADSNSSLATDGGLFAVAGAPLDDMTVTVNGVDLNALPFTTIRKLGGDLNGAHLTATDFDAAGDLDAKLTMVHLHNGWDESVLIPCVAGLLTIENNDSDSDDIESGSSVCFDAVDAGALYQIPSNGILADSPDDETQFMVFGDDAGTTSFVMGVPGIHNNAQNDDLVISVSGENVCVEFDGNRDLAEHGEIGDTASILWYICQVSDTGEAFAASRVYGASRGMYNLGSHPADFDETLDRDNIAEDIGRSDFINNPTVMTFLKPDVRDSFVNYYQGNKANIFFSGKGLSVEYTAYLNGTGAALAEIVTGPEGQWSGGINVSSAKAGDFIRFKASDSNLESGAFFDIPLFESCDPPPAS